MVTHWRAEEDLSVSCAPCRPTHHRSAAYACMRLCSLETGLKFSTIIILALDSELAGSLLTTIFLFFSRIAYLNAEGISYNPEASETKWERPSLDIPNESATETGHASPRRTEAEFFWDGGDTRSPYQRTCPENLVKLESLK